MTVKLNHYWSIGSVRKKDYDKFIIDDFIPGVNRLGVHTVAGWSVMVGAYSEIIIETVANDLDHLENALRNPGYQRLKASLLNYIRNYKTKVLINANKKNSYTTDIMDDSVKFNQMWDVLGDQKEAFERYTTEVFYPALEELGIAVAQEWEVLIGDGPHIICEGRVNDISSLINNLQSKRFRTAKRKLAVQFAEFLTSPEVSKVKERYGYH